jgi:hypothetical protein
VNTENDKNFSPIDALKIDIIKILGNLAVAGVCMACVSTFAIVPYFVNTNMPQILQVFKADPLPSIAFLTIVTSCTVTALSIFMSECLIRRHKDI